MIDTIAASILLDMIDVDQRAQMYHHQIESKLVPYMNYYDYLLFFETAALMVFSIIPMTVNVPPMIAMSEVR